jgi:hypothetical protein
MWAFNYFTHGSIKLPQLEEHVDMGKGAMSISRYFTEMLDPAMSWDDVAALVREWGGQFCLKGIISGGASCASADVAGVASAVRYLRTPRYPRRAWSLLAMPSGNKPTALRRNAF